MATSSSRWTSHNTSVEPVTITALTDDNALSEECLALIGTTLDVGGSTSCQYTASHTEAGSYPNTASVTVKDNENNHGHAPPTTTTVTVTDVQPTLTVLKTGGPVASVNEPGATVVFTFKVTNTAVEPVTIATLTDTDFTLTGDSRLPGRHRSCRWAAGVSSPRPSSSPATPPTRITSNTFTATATDNDGNTATASESETVGFDDVLPTVDLTKDVTPATLAEPGGVFHFSP